MNKKYHLINNVLSIFKEIWYHLWDGRLKRQQISFEEFLLRDVFKGCSFPSIYTEEGWCRKNPRKHSQLMKSVICIVGIQGFLFPIVCQPFSGKYSPSRNTQPINLFPWTTSRFTRGDVFIEYSETKVTGYRYNRYPFLWFDVKYCYF